MYSLLQDLRDATGLLRKAASSSVTTALIIALVLAIDVVTFANLGKAAICHLSCNNLPRSVGAELEGARTGMCRLYSSKLIMASKLWRR